MTRDYAGVRIELREHPALPRELVIDVQPTPRMRLVYAGREETIALPGRFDAYGAVLLDALSGNQRRFLGEREVIAAWRYTDRLLELLPAVPLHTYDHNRPF
jgi:glucose-6-phosphate 1-dehydrogenase